MTPDPRNNPQMMPCPQDKDLQEAINWYKSMKASAIIFETPSERFRMTKMARHFETLIKYAEQQRIKPEEVTVGQLIERLSKHGWYLRHEQIQILKTFTNGLKIVDEAEGKS